MIFEYDGFPKPSIEREYSCIGRPGKAILRVLKGPLMFGSSFHGKGDAMLLKDLFRDEMAVVTMSANDSVYDCAAKMKHENVGAVVVTADRKVIGIVTDRDIALSIALGTATPTSTVQQIMTKDVKTIWDDQSVFNATQYFQGHKVRRLPVVDHQDNLVGMISMDDLFALLSREMFDVARGLESSLEYSV